MTVVSCLIFGIPSVSYHPHLNTMCHHHNQGSFGLPLLDLVVAFFFLGLPAPWFYFLYSSSND